MNPFKSYPIRLNVKGFRHEIYDKNNKLIIPIAPKTADRFYLKALAEQLQFMVDATNARCQALEAMENTMGSSLAVGSVASPVVEHSDIAPPSGDVPASDVIVVEKEAPKPVRNPWGRKGRPKDA